jgi:hypothetical protein
MQPSTTDLEEGCRDGQVRVVPETHGEHGVYLATILQAHSSNTRRSLEFRLERRFFVSFVRTPFC